MRSFGVLAVLWACAAEAEPSLDTVRLGGPLTLPDGTTVEVAPFLLAKTELTQGVVIEVTGANPMETEPILLGSWAMGPCAVAGVGAGFPIGCVTFREAIDLANAVSKRDGLTPAYTVDGDTITWDRTADGWRLPTQAEWWLAAGLGIGVFPWGDLPEAACAAENVNDRAGERTHPGWTAQFPCDDGFGDLSPVGRFPANRHGLHDVGGNVSEWVWGTWRDLGDRLVATASTDLLHGGSAGSQVGPTRTGHATEMDPTVQMPFLGVRLARNAPATP